MPAGADAVIVQGVVRGYAAGPPAVVTVEIVVGGQYVDVAAASHLTAAMCPVGALVVSCLQAATSLSLPVDEGAFPRNRTDGDG